MSKRETYGGYKTCRTCGKVFYVLRPEMWAYKAHVGTGHDLRTLYFHTYSCKREFDKSYAQLKKERYSNSHKKERKPVVNHTCAECQYMTWDGIHGFYTCSFGVSLCVYKKRPACKRYKERIDGQREIVQP